MFELLSKTKTKIIDVDVLSQKNREPGDNPGAKISVEQQLSNDMLAFFDGHLRPFLYTKKPTSASQAAGKQGTLEGLAVSDTPNLTPIGSHVGFLKWSQELTGYTMTVDLGLGGPRSNLTISDCKLSNWRFIPKEGGTVVTRYDIESNDISKAQFGELAVLKSREVDMTLEPPDVSDQADIEDKAPRLTPAQLRAANTEGKTIEQKAKEVKGAEGMGTVAWPFPQDGKPGSGPNAKSVPPADATSAVLADVKKNGPGHSADPKPKPPAKKTAATKVESRRPAAYRDPKSGQTWTGRGLKPLWLAQALAGGAKLADFQVKAH